MQHFADSRYNRLFQALTIVFLCLVIYMSSLTNGFIWDDDTNLYNSLWLQAQNGLKVIWSLDKMYQFYPLTFTSFWLEHKLWGLNPAGYHTVNMLLHIFNALIFFRIVRILYPRGAFIAALLFAIHPIQVETVAWITERKNLLGLFFFLLAFLAFIRVERTKKLKDYFLTIALFVCALLSKSIAASFIAVPVLYEWWKRGTVTRQTIRFSLILFAIGLSSALLSVYLELYHAGAHGTAFALSLPEKFILSGRIILFYIYKISAPFNFVFIYPRWTVNIHQWWQWLFPAAAISTLAILIIGNKKIGRGALALFVFYLISIFPVMGFLNVFSMQFSFVADHYSYLTTPCLFLLLSAGLIFLYDHVRIYFPELPSRLWRIIKYVALGLVVIYLSGSVMVLTRNYADETTLWTNVLKANSKAGIAYINLGVIYSQLGRNEEAIGLLKKALETDYRKAITYNNLGLIYADTGKAGEAESAYQKAIEIEPELSYPYLNLSILYFQQKKYASALKYADLTIEHKGVVPAEFLQQLKPFQMF